MGSSPTGPTQRTPWYLRIGLWIVRRRTAADLLPPRLLAWYPRAAIGSGVLEALVAHRDGALSERILKMVRMAVSFTASCPFCIGMNSEGWEALLTPEELAAFVQAAAAGRKAAVEHLVDDLLASPQYGERWARKWLDLARYADSNGYEKDRTRSIWPWRDWVVRALNADMGFDEFTIEQVAGDLLPHPTRDQLIATGFHRNTMLNEEGGIDPLEFRYHAMTDRVATTGATWLGLTLGCAQ